ncbi:MAG: hypothetical protein ACOCQ4_02015 [bacterium]
MEQLFQAIGKLTLYGGGTVAVAFITFRFLSKKWIENIFKKDLEDFKAKKNQQLEEYKYRINSLFSRITKIHDKEFEILPRAWCKLQDAIGAVAEASNPLFISPNFDAMEPTEIDDSLCKSVLTENQKTELKAASNKNDYYNEIIISHRINTARRNVQEFHNYLLYNKIFMTRGIFEAFTELDNSLYNSVIDTEIAYDQNTPKDTYTIYKNILEKTDSNLKKLEGFIQARLHYDQVEQIQIPLEEAGRK